MKIIKEQIEKMKTSNLRNKNWKIENLIKRLKIEYFKENLLKFIYLLFIKINKINISCKCVYYRDRTFLFYFWTNYYWFLICK